MDVAQSLIMAEDENNIGKVQKDVEDIGKDDNTSISNSEENLRGTPENLPQEAKKMVDEDKKSPDTIQDDITNFETKAADKVRENPGKVEKISTGYIYIFTQTNSSNFNHRCDNFG